MKQEIEIEKPVEITVDEDQLKKQIYKNKATTYNKKYYEKNKHYIFFVTLITLDIILVHRVQFYLIP